ncbi:MAG: AI-2E family transporter, partial [Cytophagales bacterium]|nr:AI-2E family transporter [Cytophaga sp.]
MTNSFLFQATLFLIFIFLVITGMIYAGTFLIPVLFGGLLSLLLLPLSNKIESKIKSRIAAIAITITLFIVAITVIIYFISSQVSNIVSDFDFIQSRLKIQFSVIQVLINKYFGMDEGEQLAWFNQQSNEWLKSGISYIQDFILGFGNFLFNLTLVIIYIFFFLLYRGRIKLFILALFKPEQHIMVLYIINKVKKLVLNYLMGLFIALSIVGTMNAVG